MLKPISDTIQSVINTTWPVIIISTIIMISFRLCYLLKNHKKIILYHELWMLMFAIYILCLFQVVTFQDDTPWASNNFIPFREISRYSITSRLFFKNVVGNMIMFFPFGLFISYYLKADKIKLPLLLTSITSVAIECVQLAIGRVFDVDDILLNILGGVIGYLFYSKLKQRLPNLSKKEKLLNILSIISLLVLVIGIIMVLI